MSFIFADLLPPYPEHLALSSTVPIQYEPLARSFYQEAANLTLAAHSGRSLMKRPLPVD